MPIQPTTNTAAQPIDPNKKDQQKGTGFTNINKILDANQGAGQRMGNKIGSQLTQQADSVRQGIQAGQNQFQQQKNQAGQQAQGAVQAGQNLTQQAGETQDAYAQRLAQNNGNFQQVGQNLQNAEYTGPMALQNAGKLNAQASTTAALGRLAGDTQGQTQLLQSMVAKPGQYSRGQSALDALLLGSGGQRAIQQGRRAAVGLEDKALGATSQAENQANALKSGISQSRDKTLADLRNAVTGDAGFRNTAAQQAQTFQTDASDLSKILGGQFDTSTPEGKARAQDLVSRMGEFGLDNYNVYDKDDAAAKAAISQLGGTLTQDYGARKYTDNQKLASQNLASLLGDKDLQTELANDKFNTDVFGKEEDVFKGLDQNRTYDTETKGILNTAGQNAKRIEDYVAAQKQAMQEGFARQDAENAANPNNTATSDFDINALRQNMLNSLTSRYETDRSLGDMYSGNDAQGNPYGFLAYGDRGDADLGQRFQNLGLNKENNVSGQYRSSGAFEQAANKALGPDAQLRDFILNKILGAQG